MAEKFILHYAGEKFPFDHDPLAEYALHEPQTIKLDRGNGKYVTITTGPGIPVMVQNLGERKPRQTVFV